MACATVLITGAFERECDIKPVQGISRAWIGNWSELDKTASTTVKGGTVLTNLALLDNANLIFELEGDEDVFQGTSDIVIGDFENGFTHNFSYRILYQGPDQLEQLRLLTQKAKVFIIAEMVDRGRFSEETRFRVFGYENGLIISAAPYDSNADGGSTLVTLTTKENQEETTPPKLYYKRTAGTDTDDGTADDVYSTETDIIALTTARS